MKLKGSLRTKLCVLCVPNNITSTVKQCVYCFFLVYTLICENAVTGNRKPSFWLWPKNAALSLEHQWGISTLPKRCSEEIFWCIESYETEINFSPPLNVFTTNVCIQQEPYLLQGDNVDVSSTNCMKQVWSSAINILKSQSLNTVGFSWSGSRNLKVSVRQSQYSLWVLLIQEVLHVSSLVSPKTIWVWS